MELSDIKRYLAVGASRTVTIYCELCREYIGYVQTITIMSERLVQIEYEVYGYDEAGITYSIKYNDFGTLIKSLQEYLGKSYTEWNIINRTGYYPGKPQMQYDINNTHKLIRRDFVNDRIILPQYGKVMINEGYWKRMHDNKEKCSEKN